jgi:hypothetical protein
MAIPLVGGGTRSVPAAETLRVRGLRPRLSAQSHDAKERSATVLSSASLMSCRI